MANSFQILMIDPPWKKKKGGLRRVTPNQTRELDYATMSTKEIFMLLDNEIFSKADNPHCVFIWTIEQYLLECEAFMQKRNYKRHCRFIWNKTNGVAPAFTVRFTHEYLIWYYKSPLLAVARECRGKLQTVFSEKPREHSRKPDYAYEMIERLYPGSRKLDVFSREKRSAWEQFGNELNYFTNGQEA